MLELLHPKSNPLMTTVIDGGTLKKTLKTRN